MKRPPPNRLGMYDDVRKILDAALQAGGGSYELPSYGSAVHWRQRAYKFRKLYAETIAGDNSTAMSPYDKLTMPRIDLDSTIVEIKVRQAAGVFVPANEPYASPIGLEDELFDVARELADKLAKGR